MNVPTYVSNYVNNALHCPEIPVPDQTQSAELYEVLVSIHRAHCVGGTEAANTAWAKIIELAPELTQITKNAPKHRLLTISDLKNLPPLEWLVPGMIPKRAVCEIHGAPGSGKSLFVLDIALQVAETSPVIYLAAEGSSGYSIRIEAWELANNKTASANLYFYLDTVNLLDDREVGEFISLIEPVKPILIVIDTLARNIVGADENSSKDMGLAFKACSRLGNATGASVLIVHHTGKSGTSERGSSVLRSNCDSMIELTNSDDLITVTSKKLKDGKTFNTQHFTMKEFGQSVALVQVSKSSSKSPIAQALKENDLKVLEMLSLEIFRDCGAAYRRIIDHTGINNRVLDKVLSRLKKEGYISQSKKGEPYLITDTGRECAA